MAVFPENMDKLNADDVPGSFAKVQDYIRYMTERVEFAMRNVTRNVSAAGVSSAEIYVLVNAQAQQVANLSSEINGVEGDVTELQKSVSAQTKTIAQLQSGLQAAQEDITSLQTELSALTARVTALEQAGETV